MKHLHQEVVLLFIVKHAMAIALIAGIRHLRPKLLTDALIVLCPLQTAGAISASAPQSLPDSLHHFLVLIQPDRHISTSLPVSLYREFGICQDWFMFSMVITRIGKQIHHFDVWKYSLSILNDDPYLTVYISQVGILQLGNVGKRFLGRERNKFFPQLAMPRHRLEPKVSGSEPLSWNSGLQAKLRAHGHQHPQILRCIPVRSNDLVDHLARQLAAASKAQIQPLLIYIHLADGLVPQHHIIDPIQKAFPLCLTLCGKGGIMPGSCGSAVVEAKADGNGIVHHSHLLFVQPSHMFPQPPLIDGADLFQQDHRIL